MDKSAAIIDQDIYIFKVMHHRCMHVTFLFTFNHGFLYEDLVYAVKICVLVLFWCFFSQRLDETKKKKDFIFLIWIIFLRKSYQTHDTHYLSLLLISFLSRQKKLYVFFGKEKIYIDFNTVMTKQQTKRKPMLYVYLHDM